MTPAVRAFVEVLFGRIEELENQFGRLQQELKKANRFGHAEKPANASIGAPGTA